MGEEAHNATSVFRDIPWYAGREQWVAEIRVDGEPTYLESFSTEIEAGNAYHRAALKLYDPTNTIAAPDDYDVEVGEKLPWDIKYSTCTCLQTRLHVPAEPRDRREEALALLYSHSR